MSKEVTWVCDTRLTQYRRNIGQPSVEEACRALGVPVIVVDYDTQTKNLPDDLPDPSAGPLVAYGTHQFIWAMRRRCPTYLPGDFGHSEELSYAAVAGHLGDLMLNDDFVILPYGEVLRRGCDGLGESFFIKPADRVKAFTGFVMTRAMWATEVETIRQKAGIGLDNLCVVARPQAIEAEFRFVIADREVVTGSQYRWDDRLDVRLDVLPICREMAERVARQRWQPDRCYTCDVALLDGHTKARVVELNSFSSAGLYACDTLKIVEAVSRSARRSFDFEDGPGKPW